MLSRQREIVRDMARASLLAACVAVCVGAAIAHADPATQARVLAAREATRLHAEDLRINLHEALKTSGVKGAIGACSSLPTEIDTKINQQTGFDIGRTALKLRNPENAPDAWERSVLEDFVRKLAAGADAKSLEAYEVQPTTEGQRLFRYMRPIMMGEPCLACHGPNIPQEIKALIARTYSEDKATGFNLGELRGAFSLVQVVD